jgi:hypothetical protein
MKRRRNAPLTEAQANALRSLLSSHGASTTAANPAKRKGKRRAAKRTSGKKRTISPSLRRKLIANLRKARAAKKRKASKRRSR